MDHPEEEPFRGRLFTPSPTESQTHRGAEVASPPAKKKDDKVYMPIENVQLEEIEMYRENGFHPVHLGDKLHNDDLEVVAKLGDGGFGTVWLCQEGLELDGHTSWRAVKIIAASESHDDNPELRIIDELRNEGVTRAEWEKAGIMLPMRHFWLQGPNGTHLCLVFPVMGPSILSQMEASTDTIKDVLTQAGTSLRFLHAHGICHGDFTSDNILLHINDVEKVSRKEMMTLLEAPQTYDVRLADGSKPRVDRAPRYLVYRSDIGILGSKTQTATIDFGISYSTGNPPPFLGTPAQYAAPEVFFGTGNTGETTDVWSYACMIMEVYCQGQFIDPSKRSPYVRTLEVLLGRLPDSYRLAWREELEDEGVAVDDDDESKPVTMTAKDLEALRQDLADFSGYADYLQGLVGAPRVQLIYQRDANYTPSPTKVMWRVPEEEVFQLADLFRKVLKYDPDERISMEEVLQHEWFQVGAAGDREKATKASPRIQTSYGGKRVKINVPETEEKGATKARPARPAAKTPGTVDEVRFKKSRIPIATEEPLGIDSEGARVYDDQQWKDRAFSKCRQRRYHSQAVAQRVK